MGKSPRCLSHFAQARCICPGASIAIESGKKKAMSANPNTPDRKSIDLAAASANLAQGHGKRFWQSLEELSETPEYREFLDHEFPYEREKNRKERTPRVF